MPDMSSSFLSAFLFAFPVLQLWSCFPSLVDWTFQVFGQLEYFNQRDELLFGELVIINAKGSEERTVCRWAVVQNDTVLQTNMDDRHLKIALNAFHGGSGR